MTLNAYRQAGLSLDPGHPIYAATASVCIAQALQSTALLIFLGATRPAALRAVFASWRQSLGAGFCGAAASACWFAALALAPAGAVRAVGVIEAPIAAAAGRRLFKEKLNLRQIAGGVLTAGGSRDDRALVTARTWSCSKSRVMKFIFITMASEYPDHERRWPP